MGLHTALATAATLVALAFALSLYERWLANRHAHELAWTVAMAMFAVASGALAAGAAVGWSPVLFRTFYLFGAVANVPILALGTVFLLARWETARRIGQVVVVAVAVAAGVIIAAPLRGALPRDHLAQGSDVFGVLPRVLAAVASAGGALVVFGGALWSALRQRRLVIANTLIALGTAVTGASGVLNSVADAMTGFAVTLVIGVTLIFVGFLVSATATSGAAPSRPSSAATH
ncbi:MAG TPA: hypothetical protein VFB78_19125 [Acidimicrobiales bacterium]|nr:hypothetical protein [Acidimicrobiales bacterium]